MSTKIKQETESHASEQPIRDPDEISLDESLIHLCRILMPRWNLILFLSAVTGVAVGLYLYVQPRQYVCTAVISPGGVRDTIDLVQYQITDESTLMDTSTVKEISQLKVLAESSQVKKALIKKHGLMDKWDCETELECIRKLNDIYKVKEIRSVGLEITATLDDEPFSYDLLQSGIEETNDYFQESIKSNAQKSIEKIKGWIEDATKEYQQVSDEFIRFASENNITDIEQQNKDALALLNSLNSNIVDKEVQLVQKQQTVSPDSIELKPLKEAIREIKEKIKALQFGSENADTLQEAIYFPTSKYQQLKILYNQYQSRITQLQSQLEIFTKRLATLELEAESSLQSLITLNEPNVEPASKGSVKFAVLTVIGVFFLLCIFFIFQNYIRELKKHLQSQA